MIRTRFAPSPTGYLHIGGVRTALFNFLFARHYDGIFILRIDDTDTERNVKEAVAPILDGLRWAGIEWDAGPFYQSGRKRFYADAARELIEKGKAYADDGAIRLRLSSPAYGIDDLVRGRVEWNLAERQDPVIVRSDGSYLYNFATVVDDHNMEITHVLRAEEHLSNTPVQLAIYEALGWTPPVFAHIPLVCAPNSRKKLSKREVYDNLLPKGHTSNLNPVFLDYYEKTGYLPEAVFNYLALLGWSYDDKTEIMSPQEIADRFSIERVLSSPASFDPNKIYHFASQHFNRLPLDERVHKVVTFYGGKYQDRNLVAKALECCADRVKLLSDFERLADFFFTRPSPVKTDGPEWIAFLEWFVDFTNGFNDPAQIEKASRQLCDPQGVEFRDFVKHLRLAITGNSVGPRLFEAMIVLGAEECQARIANYKLRSGSTSATITTEQGQ